MTIILVILMLIIIYSLGALDINLFTAIFVAFFGLILFACIFG